MCRTNLWNLDERRGSSLNNPIRTLQYEDLKAIQEHLKIPRHLSQRRSQKVTDDEQMRVFMQRQKNMEELWRQLGIVKVTRQGADDV